MKPLSLYIEGFQSFIQAKEIDFAALSASGFFGIFGNTGSGKSTILDALLISLFGNSGTKREQIDIINKTVNKAQLKFKFESCGNIYTVERTFKIRSSGTKDTSAVLYKDTPQGQLTIADKPSDTDKALENIIGLSCDEFKKCVILPQGEFASFINSQPNKRVDIIGNLFNLDNYGDKLLQKINLRIFSAKIELDGTEKLINSLGEILPIEKINANIKKKEDEAKLTDKQLKDDENYLKQIENDIINQSEAENALTQLNKLLQKKESIEKTKSDISIMKKAAEVLPVYNEYKEKKNYYKENSNKLNIVSSQLTQHKTDFDKALENKAVADSAYNENAENISSKINILTTLLPDAEKILKYKEKRQGLLKDYEDYKSQIDLNNQNCEKEQEKLSYVNLEIEQIEKKYDISLLMQESYIKGGLDELNSAIEYLKNGYEGALPHFNDRKTEKLNLLSSFDQTDISSLKEALITLKNLNETKTQIQNNITKYQTAIATLNEKINNIKTAGIEVKEQITELEEKFKAQEITGNITKDYIDSLIVKLKAELLTVKTNKEKCDTEYEKQKSTLNDTETAIKELKTLCNEAHKQYSEKNTALENALIKHGLTDLESLQNISSDKDYIIKAEENIKDYDLKLALAQEAYDKAKLKLKEIDQNKYQLIKIEYEPKKEYYKKLIGEIGAERQYLKEQKEKHIKIKEYLTDKKNIENKLDNLYNLHKLVKGKKFMEYAAEEYIQEITAQATRHALRLTGGRFALAYKQGNFMIEDNYSGGELRPVCTLSGGETFLVSLSLAVALSESIVRMSDKPIEFFFLDEGFGTLDRELCDTVMNTLEKLKQTHFTIGLISHVPELMHRLTHKLLLTPPDGNGNGTDIKLVC